MNVADLIRVLMALREPSREIDSEIALIAGYQQSETNARSWTDPRGAASALPYFTLDIDHALLLASFIAPHNVGGCSWEPGIASAKIGDMQIVQAATPALAICIAALAQFHRTSMQAYNGLK